MISKIHTLIHSQTVKNKNTNTKSHIHSETHMDKDAQEHTEIYWDILKYTETLTNINEEGERDTDTSITHR